MKSFILFILLSVFSTQQSGFKQQQVQYNRVKQAYLEKEATITTLLQNKKISKERVNLYLRIFKKEGEVEVWAKNTEEQSFVLLTTYQICASSGTYGPKRKRGDMQVPEGFYSIDRFNPWSNFHLSLGINYPNTSDKILATANDPGGDIFIHGSCATIGCVPITDDKIKELYLLCVEAKNNGQKQIPVTIFPSKMDNSTYETMVTYYGNASNKTLWSRLKTAYDLFSKRHTLPIITFLADGDHSVK